jgi:hypothetical protein
VKRRFLRLERARPATPTPARSLATPGRFATATSTSASTSAATPTRTATSTSSATPAATMPPDELAAMQRAEADAMFARLELEERGSGVDPRVVVQIARVAVPLVLLAGGAIGLFAGGCVARVFSFVLVAAVAALVGRRRFLR